MCNNKIRQAEQNIENHWDFRMTFCSVNGFHHQQIKMKNDDFSGTFKRLSTHSVKLKPAKWRMANTIYDTYPKAQKTCDVKIESSQIWE